MTDEKASVSIVEAKDYLLQKVSNIGSTREVPPAEGDVVLGKGAEL